MQMICSLLEGEFSLLTASGNLRADEYITLSLFQKIDKRVGKEVIRIIRKFYKVRNKHLLDEIMAVLNAQKSEVLTLTNVNLASQKTDKPMSEAVQVTVDETKPIVGVPQRRLEKQNDAPALPPALEGVADDLPPPSDVLGDNI